MPLLCDEISQEYVLCFEIRKKLEIQNQELSLAKLNDSSDSIGLDLMQKKIIFEQKIYNRTDVLQL